MGSLDTDDLDRTFRALADGTRRQIWERLGQRPGATTSQLAAAAPMLSRWAVIKHLRVLREAGLIQTLPRGRERCHYRVEASLEPVVGWLGRSTASSREDG